MALGEDQIDRAVNEFQQLETIAIDRMAKRAAELVTTFETEGEKILTKVQGIVDDGIKRLEGIVNRLDGMKINVGGMPITVNLAKKV